MLEKINHAKVKGSSVKANKSGLDFVIFEEKHGSRAQRASGGVEVVIVVL